MVHCKTMLAIGSIKVSLPLQEVIEITARRLLKASVCMGIYWIKRS